MVDAAHGPGVIPNPRDAVATRARLDALLAGPRVTAATRAVLQARIAASGIDTRDASSHANVAAAEPLFLDADDFATLAFACARLLPPGSPVGATSAAHAIDARLASGEGDGWRYDAMPPDGESYAFGLRALREAAMAEGAGGFGSLPTSRQDSLLRAASHGAAEWATVDCQRWFEELLVEVTELHVAHPITQLQMGCDAFADVPSDGDDRANEAQAIASTGSPATPTRPIRIEPRHADSGAADTKHHRNDDIVDAVVIGTGAGGGPLLWRLARAGLSVVALEAGTHWNPTEDFATDEKAQAKLFWRDERLSAGSDPLAFGSNNSGIGVGGSTLHYTAYVPRPQRDDFHLHRDFGVGCDWPIGYADLEPYFDELEQLIGVSGPSDYPWGAPRRSSYPLPPLPLNAPARLMQAACAQLGIATSPAPNAALSRDWAAPGHAPRQRCTERGFCQAGCSTGAKGSVDVVFIPPALAHGAELRTGCVATRIEREAGGHVTGVVYMQDGAEKRQRCRHVFLCAGAIETPRLLLMHAGSGNDALANSSGQVGRNFMAHTGLQLWGHFDAPTTPWRGIPGGLISEDMHRPKDQGSGFAGGYLLQSIGVMPVTYASQLARSGQALFGSALADHLARFNHVAGINILGECLPYERNFLELSSERDARGLFKPRIHFSAGDNEARLTAHADRTMRAIWQAAGAQNVWAFPRFAHVIGTCRMGTDASKAVADADGRVFDVPGLTICDNSIFPSALSANPSLTIMALSLRIADRHLATRHEARRA